MLERIKVEKKSLRKDKNGFAGGGNFFSRSCNALKKMFFEGGVLIFVFVMSILKVHGTAGTCCIEAGSVLLRSEPQIETFIKIYRILFHA